MQKAKAKGITLVSLIITVIVMLILAGVSISLLLNPKGVVERGKVVAEETNISNYSEALGNIGIVLMPEKVEKKLSGKSYMDRYEEEIRKEAEGGSIDGSTVTRQNDETVRVVTEEGYVFDVTEREVKYVGKQGEEPAPPAIIETDLEFKTDPEELTNKDVVVTIIPKIAIDENYTIQYAQKNLNEEPKETDWKNYALGTEIKFTQKGNVFVRLINKLSETGQSFTHTVNNIDKQEPNTFTAKAEPVSGNKSNSIIVKGHTTDKPETTEYAHSGIKEYYFKQVGAEDTAETIKQIKDWGDPVEPNGDNDVSKTFEGLTQGGEYYFVIKGVDNAGNETITEKVQANTEPVPGLTSSDITFNATPVTWTKDSVTVTISLTKTFAGYTLQYAQKDKDQMPSDDDWNTCSSGKEVTLTKNGNVFARLIDNNKQEGTMIASEDISNIDTTLPAGDNSGITTTVTDTQITANLNVTDEGGSGLAKVEWKYSAKGKGMGTAVGTNDWSELHTEVSKPGEASKTANTTIKSLVGATEYDIKAIIYDVAGNTKEVTKLAVKTNPTRVSSITLKPTSLSIKEKATGSITATISPTNATNKTVTWKSENVQIATVKDNKNGTATVTGVKAGTTNIVATADGVTKKCSVEVKPDYVAATVEEGSRKAPIPKGYVASQIPGENKISDGLVIYEGTAAVTGTKGSSAHTNAMKTRNQYVWIPVDDINKMVMCQYCGAKGTLTYDSTNNTLKCKNESKSGHGSTKLAGKLYATEVYENFNSGLTTQTYNANGLREPAVIPGDSSYGITSMQTDFDNMAKSVAKYKGFYLSRYEMQANGTSIKGKAILNSDKNSVNMWYGLYNTIKSFNKPNNSTVYQMIWGCQYDQVMLFVNQKKDGAGNTFDVKRQNKARLTRYLGVSGLLTADLVCNIYDLEGNYFEWTTEACGNSGRISRGANPDGTGSASFRYNHAATDNRNCFSSRPTLYVAF